MGISDIFQESKQFSSASLSVFSKGFDGCIKKETDNARPLIEAQTKKTRLGIIPTDML